MPRVRRSAHRGQNTARRRKCSRLRSRVSSPTDRSAWRLEFCREAFAERARFNGVRRTARCVRDYWRCTRAVRGQCVEQTLLQVRRLPDRRRVVCDAAADQSACIP